MSTIVGRRFWEKTTPKGQVLLTLEECSWGWRVRAYADGQYRDSGELREIGDGERRRNKLPDDAAISIGTTKPVIFRTHFAAEILAAYRAAIAAAEAEAVATAAAVEPDGYLFEVGCDRGNTYRVLLPDGLPDHVARLVRERMAAPQIKKYLTVADFERIGVETSAAAEGATGGSYWGLRFDRTGLESLRALALEREAAAGSRRSARDAAFAAEVAARMARARETGEPVELGRWTEDCDDVHAECDLDIVVRYAMPDGSITTRRTHTY